MRILVYGAGVLGSLYAYRLQASGHDVSLLARGQRLEDLRRHGLVLEDLITKRRVTAPITVVEQLAPDDAYDLVLVIMGYHQVPSVLPALAANHHMPNVMFMGNNAAGPGAMIAALGRERVVLGFPIAMGTRIEHVVHCAAGIDRMRARAVIGELDGAVTPRLKQIAAAFEGAGIKTEICANMDAWLKCHAAVIVALAGAYYGANMDARRLSRTRDALVLSVRATREGLRALRALGIPILPPRNGILFNWLPEPVLVGLLSQLLRLQLYQYALIHAGHARPELQSLAVEFSALSRASCVPTPNLNLLCAATDPNASLIAEGSAHIPMDWSQAWAKLAVLASGLLVLRLMRKR